jgi:hypothetical protein
VLIEYCILLKLYLFIDFVRKQLKYHCIEVLAVPLDILGSRPAAARRPMGQHTIGPASSGLGEGLADRDVLVPSRTSDSCGGPGVVHADQVVSSDTLVRLASGLSGHCVKKQCGLVGLCPCGSCSDETRL